MEKVREFIKQHQKLAIAGIVLLALTMPLLINQVLTRQDLHQRASSAPAISLRFDPALKTIGVNGTIDVQLLLTTGTNDVGSLKFTMNYDSTLLEVTDISYPSSLKDFNTSNTNGAFQATLLNPSSTQVTGQDINVVTFRVKGLKAGTAQLQLSQEKIQATATGVDAYLPVSSSSLTATYTVTSSSVTPSKSEDTPDATPTKVTPTTTISPTTKITITVSPTPTNIPSPTPKQDEENNPTPTNAPTATLAPTSTLAPTATVAPGDTSITLKAILPGIGVGTPNLGLNSTPIHPQRSATIQVLDANNTVVKTVNGTKTFSSSNSSYTGTFGLGSEFESGQYSVKVKFNNTLYKTIPAIIQITKGQNTSQNIPTAVLVTGDLNNDNTLGVIDWTLIIACIKNEAACTSSVRSLADLNDNGTVDEPDVQILQRGFALRNGD